VDVVFALDASTGVGSDQNWALIKLYVGQIIQQLALGTTGANFGLMTFGFNSNNQFFLNNYTTDYVRLINALMSIPYPAGQAGANIPVSISRHTLVLIITISSVPAILLIATPISDCQ
jgi:hypothetical protein